MKGLLTIGRLSSVNKTLHNKITIEVKDEKFDTVAKITVGADQFALAITGLAFQECEIEISNAEHKGL